MSAPQRVRAARVVEEVARRLSDPDAVVAATRANAGRRGVDESRSPLWEPGSLNRGYPGLVLLPAELGLSAPDSEGHRLNAHRYLELSAAATRARPAHGAFAGVGALASAARVAAGADGDYAGLLARTDARMAEHAHRLVALHVSTRAAGEPTYPALVDVLSGLSGVGRYLLHRRRAAAPDVAAALRAALGCLVSLRLPLSVRGVEVPGWWFGATSRTRVAEEFADGQVNLGLAHGVPGPLALLSLAWEEGVRVDGQAEAIEGMARWLLEWREEDAAGPYWTAYMPLRYYADRRAWPTPLPARPSWCYGAVGTARALDLAGRALGRPEWVGAGLEAVRAMLRRPVADWGVVDDALCHGRAGILYLLGLFHADHPEAGFGPAVEESAARLLAGFDPEAPFGFRFHQPAADLDLDMPGFLDGAAGIALALHAYATGRPPASGWDTLLLLR